jgi:hypothetical protein
MQLGGTGTLGLGLGLGLGLRVGFVHTFATHVWPAAHALLHPPQCLGSVAIFTHTVFGAV